MCARAHACVCVHVCFVCVCGVFRMCVAARRGDVWRRVSMCVAGGKDHASKTSSSNLSLIINAESLFI